MQSARISLFLRGSGSVRLLKWWKDNKVKPKVSKVFNVEDTKYALQALINREVIGKAVIKVR